MHAAKDSGQATNPGRGGACAGVATRPRGLTRGLPRIVGRDTGTARRTPRCALLALVLCALADACLSPMDIDSSDGAWSTGGGGRSGTTGARCPAAPGLAGSWTGKLGPNELSLTLSESCRVVEGFFQLPYPGWFIEGEWVWDGLSGRTDYIGGSYTGWINLEQPCSGCSLWLVDVKEPWKSAPVRLRVVSVTNDTLSAQATGSWINEDVPGRFIGLFNDQPVKLSKKPLA